MVLRTRTSCSFKWRACMELRCDWRSTNISETSRFEYSISYILRLLAISSTENAQCGVLPSSDHHLLKHRFRPCCTANETSCVQYYIPEYFSRQALRPPWHWIRRATGEWRTVLPTSGSPNAMEAFGGRAHGKRHPAAATRTIPMSQNRTGRRSECRS